MANREQIAAKSPRKRIREQNNNNNYEIGIKNKKKNKYGMNLAREKGIVDEACTPPRSEEE